MSAPPPTPSTRPRAVTVGFWCWIAGDVLLAAFGLLMAFDPTPNVPAFVRGAGALLVAVGLAHGFLVGRVRRGNQRFAYAAIGLAMATVAVLAVLLLFGASLQAIVIVAVIMILMITGSTLIRGKLAQAWFDGEAGA